MIAISPVGYHNINDIFFGGGGEFTWLRQIAASLPPWSSGFCPWPVDDGLVVDEVALAQEFLRVIRVSLCTIPPTLHTRISRFHHRYYTSINSC